MLFAFFLNGKIPEFPWKKKSKNGQKCSLHFSRQNIRVSRCGHEQVHSIFSKIKEKITRLRLSDCSELVKRTKFSVNNGQRIKSQSSGLKRAKICKKLRERRKGDFSKKRPEKCEKKASLFGLGLQATYFSTSIIMMNKDANRFGFVVFLCMVSYSECTYRCKCDVITFKPYYCIQVGSG